MTIEQIERTIRSHDPKLWRVRDRQWVAATALVVAPGPGGEPHVLVIRRAERAGDPWSGHIALPGGKQDPTDEDLAHTARREAWEEVGVELGEPVGRLNDMSGRAFRAVVATFVWVLDDKPALDPEPGEVDEAFWVPLDDLYSREKRTLYRVRRVPTPFRAVKLEGGVLWGMTYGIFWHFGKVIGRRLPRHRRRVNLRRVALRR